MLLPGGLTLVRADGAQSRAPLNMMLAVEIELFSPTK
jgi:hypothetical protein